MNSRIQGSAIGAGSALAQQVRETPHLIQLCNAISTQISNLRGTHARINDAVCRLQNPRPESVGRDETLNHPQPQTLEGRLQEISRELEILVHDAAGTAVRLDEAV